MTRSSDAPVHIVPYDPTWPALFEVERESLGHLLAPWLTGPIAHVGSTAVPGMPAKPVIDVMVGVGSLEESRQAVRVLQDVGYQYAPYYRTDVMHWLCKPSFAFRTHHLHLVPYRSPLWQERLAFRDCLRSDGAVARAYAELKHRLARVHQFDREAYTEAKGPFINEILKTVLHHGGPSTE